LDTKKTNGQAVKAKSQPTDKKIQGNTTSNGKDVEHQSLLKELVPKQFSNFPFGFIWKNNSCAFDTVITTLVHLFAKLSTRQQAVLLTDLTEFVTLSCLSAIGNNNDGFLWNDVKGPLRQRVHNVTSFATMSSIWKRLFPEDISKNSCVIRTSRKPHCSSSKCMVGVKLWVLEPCYEVFCCDVYYYQSIAHWFSFKADVTNTKKYCKNCGLRDYQSKFIPELPIILYLNFADAHIIFSRLKEIDRELVIDGQIYDLHGVGYHSFGHFRSRFIHNDGNVYEYEGMAKVVPGEHAVRCSAINMAPFFPITANGYTVNFAMYLKRER
jgi:hypothetical protein